MWSTLKGDRFAENQHEIAQIPREDQSVGWVEAQRGGRGDERVWRVVEVLAYEGFKE